MPKTNLAIKPDGAGRIPQRRLKILVLDDDEFDRRHVQRLSEQMAFPTDIEEASDLIALQEKLDSEVYDAILVDYRLSNGNGLDALDIIAAHKENGSAAQIMVAGDPTYELAVQAMKHGCDEFLGKEMLNAQSMQKSVLGAILASTKKASANLQVELQDLANAVANGVAELCLTNMQPMLSGIVRKTRILKEHEETLSAQSTGAITIIEQSCSVLKDFLDDMDSRASQIADTRAKIVPLIK